MPQIRFGTDGWRAVIAKEFTFSNCRLVAQGIALYLKSVHRADHGLVVAYDNRFMSPEFARECCRVLVGNGIKVWFMEKVAPTPLAAYAVRLKEASGAIVITASHNAAHYNGIKYIPDYAGPALPDVTGAIEQEIEKVADGGKIYEINLKEAYTLGLYQEIDVENEYFNHLLRIIRPEIIKSRPLRIVIDPMYGAGIGFLERFLTMLGCEVKTIHNHRDVLFGGDMPEPLESHLCDLQRAVVSYNADIGLALDGDGDRFGIVDHSGAFKSGNQILCLVLNYLLQTRNHPGPVCRTIATTHMLDRIARAYGRQVIETPVGFKYVSEAMREHDGHFGAEESGGLSAAGHIPEKDGILACLLVVEMMSAAGRKLPELISDLESEYGVLVSRRTDMRVSRSQIPVLHETLLAFRPKTIGGLKVKSTCDRDGVYWVLEDGSWILSRFSDTEPVLRCYIETADSKRLDEIEGDVMEGLSFQETSK